jgi:hypothetical protein
MGNIKISMMDKNKKNSGKESAREKKILLERFSPPFCFCFYPS